MESIFSGDSYESSTKKGLPFIHYLFLGTRWGMYFTFIKDIVFRYRREVIDGNYDDQQWVKSSQESLQIVERFGGRFVIRGMDNLKGEDGPYVIIANHMSTLETAVLPGIVRPHMPVTFVVKRKLTEGNVFGHIMRSRDPIAVDRVNPREDLATVLKEGEEKLKKGISIIIFPQSTRTAEFRPERFNSLGIKLAIRAGVNVIPIALKTDFWGEGSIIRGFGRISRKKKIHIEIGSPIAPQGRGKNEHQEIVDFIQSRLNTWEKEDNAG
ncbi:lysophospholipid acyltransferase family protein [Salinispira pacifica]|uniref:1-acyl-sn-glycerol-3-phosphate acyltransferase, putative n=1 Tax=Salinispira pacifica TaxID=1307761 RepID=V5WH41_9SPIO|nr:lysophospholipid acyltransferase family protein [Salinispira pacifica]AHC14945.1 1-acyl-sn-glycerol-3-phosphate acyltransferase, putative [Salinispira pacifica]